MNKCPNYSEGYGCSTSPLKQCDTCPDYKLYNHWKPSKEQMKAFEHFVRSIGESGYASPYDNNTKLIHSLLNDLKNL